MTDVGTELWECLQALHAVAHELERATKVPLPEPKMHLAHLQETAASLGDARLSKSLRCPEEYVQKWKLFLNNEIHSLERRVIRYLCWHPDIATSQKFQYYLDRDSVFLEARSLQGLIRSCHSRWSAEFADSQVVTRVRDRLQRYQGSNRVLLFWKDNINLILGRKGAEEFSAKMVLTAEEIKAHCESWKIADEASAYVQAGVSHATKLCRDQMDRIPSLREYLFTSLLSWSGWPANMFKHEVSKVILHPATTQDVNVRELVRAFVLNDARLGDPRLTRNKLNWVGMGDAKSQVIEWLSQYDIVFFFESVLPKGKDPHGRKDFWLRYVSRVVRSRPLLTRDDKFRVRANLKPKDWELLNFGSMLDPNTSAFLLDFGRIIAIEFSAYGNACYLYEKSEFDKVVPDFWSTNAFQSYRLKQRKLSFIKIDHKKPRYASYGGGWEEEIAHILARRDIRPGGRT